MTDPVLELPFSAGIDEAGREELVQPGAGWTELLNLRQEQRGGVSKRLGSGGISSNRIGESARSQGNRLFMDGEHICTIDGEFLDSYSPHLTSARNCGRVPEASFSNQELWSPGRDYAIADVLYLNGYILTSYITTTISGGMVYAFVAVMDAISGAVVSISRPALYSNVSISAVRLAGYSVYAIVYIGDATNNTIVAYRLNTTSATTIAAGWAAISAGITDYSGNGLSVLSLADRTAIAYSNNAGGTNVVTVKTHTITGVVQSQTVNTGSTDPAVDGIDIAGSISDTLWIAWNEATVCKIIGLNPTTLGSTLATPATIITSGTTVGHVRVAASVSGQGAMFVEAGDNRIYSRFFRTTAGAAAANGDLVTTYGAVILGRPMYRSRYYMPIGAATHTLLPLEMVVADVTPDRDALDTSGLYSTFRPVVVPLERGVFFPGSRSMVRFDTADGENYYHAFTRKTSAVALSTHLMTMDFADQQRWETVGHGGTTYLSGGTLAMFDGSNVFEAAFLQVPKKPTTSTGSTGITATVGWTYVAVFEHVDANGNWHVSGVSPPSDSTGAVVNKTVTVTTLPLAITARQLRTASEEGQVRVAFYRTLDGGEPPYYRVGSIESYSGTSAISLADAMTDVVAASQHLLYGTGNLPATGGAGQDHRATPGLKHLTSYGGMLVGSVGSDIWFSSQSVPGEGIWFSPVFQAPVDDGGNVSAIWSQDGTLYVSKRSRLFAMSGDAPSDNGAAGGLGTPRRLSVDFGSIDGFSVTTSIGTFFRSKRGIELLTRAGQVTWVGENVKDTLAAYPVVTSMVMDEVNNLVRITLAEDESGGRVSGEGRDLVYDTTITVWQSIDDKWGSEEHQASQDAAMVLSGGEWSYAWLDVDGVVYVERASDHASAYLDGSVWVTMRAVSPWVHIAGLQGEQFLDQVLLLAKRLTGHELTISLAFDYASSFTSSKTFTAAQIVALAREWLVKEIEQTTSNAIRVKLEDASPSSGSIGTGQGATWVTMTVNGQPHRGPKRTSGEQRGV